MDRSCYETIYNKSCCPKCGGCDFDYRRLVSNSPADYPLVKHRFDKICTQCGHSASGSTTDETELNFAKECQLKRRKAMYKWNVLFYLNSGREVEGVYEGDETDSLEVIDKLINGDGKPCSFTGVNTDTSKSAQVFVKVDDISALFISAYENDKNS